MAATGKLQERGSGGGVEDDGWDVEDDDEDGEVEWWDALLVIGLAYISFSPWYFKYHMELLWQPVPDDYFRDFVIEDGLANQKQKQKQQQTRKPNGGPVRGLSNPTTAGARAVAAILESHNAQLYEFQRMRERFGIEMSSVVWLFWFVAHALVAIGWSYFNLTQRRRPLDRRYTRQRRAVEIVIVNVMVFIALVCEKGLPSILMRFRSGQQVVMPFVAVIMNFALCVTAWALIGNTGSWPFFGCWTPMPVGMLGLFYLIHLLRRKQRER